MKIVIFLFLVVLPFTALSQKNKCFKGLYSSGKINKGFSCISLNDDSVAYYVLISAGSFNSIVRTKYFLKGDTIKMPELDNFYWRNNTLYRFNNVNQVIFNGGIKKVSNRLINRLKKKYETELKLHNICFKNGILDKCN